MKTIITIYGMKWSTTGWSELTGMPRVQNTPRRSSDSDQTGSHWGRVAQVIFEPTCSKACGTEKRLPNQRWTVCRLLQSTHLNITACDIQSTCQYASICHKLVKVAAQWSIGRLAALWTGCLEFWAWLEVFQASFHKDESLAQRSAGEVNLTS